MKVKEMIEKLTLLNPESEIEFRAYTNMGEDFIDLPFSDVRFTKSRIVFSNQCGVE